MRGPAIGLLLLLLSLLAACGKSEPNEGKMMPRLAPLRLDDAGPGAPP